MRQWHDPVLDYGTKVVQSDEYDLSCEDDDSAIEEAIERERKSFYLAWFKYVREYE